MINHPLITVIAAINDWTVANSNLCASPLLHTPNVQFIPAEGFCSASTAYNNGIQQAQGELLIFAHQDVYIPKNWENKLYNIVSGLNHDHDKWGVLGVVGVNARGVIKGLSWSTGLSCQVGSPVHHLEPASSLDELLLVIKRSSGLKFDENLPGWHFYGTDIVQEALCTNNNSYIIPAPVIHNSLPVQFFDENFIECYEFIRKKWRGSLPLKSCCITLTRFGWPLRKRLFKQFLTSKNRKIFHRLQNPSIKAKELGYE